MPNTTLYNTEVPVSVFGVRLCVAVPSINIHTPENDPKAGQGKLTHVFIQIG